MLKKTLLAAAGLALAAPAFADGGHRGHDKHRHDARHVQHHPHYYRHPHRPVVVYRPAPVVYYAPPVYYRPAPVAVPVFPGVLSLSFSIPLN